MRGAVLRAYDQPVLMEELTLSEPLADEVRVQVRASGVCHSDRTAQQGGQHPPLPAVLGHEVAGEVVAVGSDVTHVRPGDPVAICSVTDCGQCEWCVGGNPQHCLNRRRTRASGRPPRLLDANGAEVWPYVGVGGFCEEILVHESAVTRIDPRMPFEPASLLGCAVITGVGAVTRSADVKAGQTMAIIGCGGVGLNAIQAGRLRGASRIIAVDLSAANLELARTFGATDVVNASETSPVEAVRDLTGGVDHAIEAVGLPVTIGQAFAMLRTMGTATCIGVTRIGDELVLPAGDLMLEKRLQGSKMGRSSFRTDAPRLVDLYLSGDLLLDELVSHTRPLADAQAALASLDGGGCARTVLTN